MRSASTFRHYTSACTLFHCIVAQTWHNTRALCKETIELHCACGRWIKWWRHVKSKPDNDRAYATRYPVKYIYIYIDNLIGTTKRILRIGSIPVNNSSELMVTVFTLYRRYAARASIVQSQPSSLFYQIDYLTTSRSFFVLTFHICHVVRRCINV